MAVRVTKGLFFLARVVGAGVWRVLKGWNLVQSC